MELIEQKLRDFLHSLLMGENSPSDLIITYGISQYIKDHSKDIGEILTVDVELNDSFIEVAKRGKILYPPMFGFQNIEGNYKIKSVQKQKYSYDDFQRRESTFITQEDIAQEKEIDNSTSFIDVRGEILSNFQNENEIISSSPLIDFKGVLRLNIQRDIEIGKYDVYCSSDVIYGNTYKLELVIFNKKLWTLSAEDHKLEYYRVYIPEEFKKLKYELEKYYEYPDQKKHLSVIDFYINKFSEEIDKQPDKNSKECFRLFNRELQSLRYGVASYYGHHSENHSPPEKLLWTGSFQEFIDFFESLIVSGEILYKGEKDKYSIYTYLLNNIYIKQNPDLTTDSIMEFLKINIPTPVKEVERCKLTWTSSRSEFALAFKNTINRSVNEKSLFSYHGKGSLRAVSKKFHEIFQIEDKYHPGKYISEATLYQAFKG